jgi:hypothetical protein
MYDKNLLASAPKATKAQLDWQVGYYYYCGKKKIKTLTDDLA